MRFALNCHLALGFSLLFFATVQVRADGSFLQLDPNWQRILEAPDACAFRSPFGPAREDCTDTLALRRRGREAHRSLLENKTRILEALSQEKISLKESGLEPSLARLLEISENAGAELKGHFEIELASASETKRTGEEWKQWWTGLTSQLMEQLTHLTSSDQRESAFKALEEVPALQKLTYEQFDEFRLRRYYIVTGIPRKELETSLENTRQELLKIIASEWGPEASAQAAAALARVTLASDEEEIHRIVNPPKKVVDGFDGTPNGLPRKVLQADELRLNALFYTNKPIETLDGSSQDVEIRISLDEDTRLYLGSLSPTARELALAWLFSHALAHRLHFPVGDAFDPHAQDAMKTEADAMGLSDEAPVRFRWESFAERYPPRMLALRGIQDREALLDLFGIMTELNPADTDGSIAFVRRFRRYLDHAPFARALNCASE